MSNCATNSEDSTANSGKKDLFKCTRCEKGFPSGQALGGNQNAHRYENNMRRLADAIGTHGSNPYVADALVEVQSVAFAAYQMPLEVNVAEWGYHGIVQHTVNLLAASSIGAYHFHEVAFAMIRSEVDNQLKKAQEGVINYTRDYLAEWENNDATNCWNGAAAGSVRSSERTVIDPILRVGHDGEEMTSEQRDDDLDLELKL
ncbi:hypothetical protein ACFX13_008933 [Malus domestica]